MRLAACPFLGLGIAGTKRHPEASILIWNHRMGCTATESAPCAHVDWTARGCTGALSAHILARMRLMALGGPVM